MTVVSLYFKLPSSKHSNSKYEKWATNFLQSVSAPLILLTDEISFEKFKIIRGNRPTTFYVVASIWALMKSLELERNNSYIQNYLNDQIKIDPEMSLHNPNLYAIWNLKPFIMKLFSKTNPYKSDFFIYTDTGAWRESRILTYWPDIEFVKKLHKEIGDKMLLGQIQPKTDDIFRDTIEGTFFAGSQEAIKIYYSNFYTIHDERLKGGSFIGKDQTIMNILAFQRYQQTVVRLQTWGVNCTQDYDAWFFYQLYFSNEYACKSPRLSLIISNQAFLASN